MGGSFYDTDARSSRATSAGYYTKSVNEVFTQQKKKRIHEDMNPKNIQIRECRDSAAHPDAFPVALFLDATGSMGSIPQQLVRDGLPTMMSKLIQNGAVDSAVLFGAVGDHECDKAPLQVSQFESGDIELDMWLTRTWLEGGGGGNDGESYLLAWQFAANHIVSDAWEKRNIKGVLFTIGDEPNLPNLPKSAVVGIYGESAMQSATISADALLTQAQEKFHVYHLHLTERGGKTSLAGWKQKLGQNCVEVKHHNDVPSVIADIVLKHYPDKLFTIPSDVLVNAEPVSSSKEEEIILS
jgi:hypothetical protein